MAKKKIKKEKKTEIRKHREFYVNNKLEFSLYFDASIKDKQKIIDDFLKDKDFVFMKNYCGWKVKKTSISDDLMKVYIEVDEIKE